MVVIAEIGGIILIGALEIMEELRHHILFKTNPHNREDIKKYNEKENATTN
jgi:hypothetical protein